VAKEPIASKRFAPLKDNATNWVTFDAQPAGEYLFQISQPKGRVGVWTNEKPTDSKGFLYLDGVEQRGEPELHLNFENDQVPAEPFGTCKPSAEARIVKVPYSNGKNKTPTNMSVSTAVHLSANAPIAGVQFNMATYTGYFMKGLRGALAATLGMVLPSFIIIILVVCVLEGFNENPYVQGALTGINAASAGLILWAAIKLGKQVLKSAFAWIVAGCAFVAIAVFDISAVWAILAGIAVGILYSTWQNTRSLGGEKE
jgi:chromate transport protein ChrA